MSRDVFLCHASEDKPAVVRPLAYELQRKGISCWLDEAEILWGQSIIERISEGLRSSRFVIVVLSRAFLSKNWPKKELSAVLSMEISSGQIRVLPILVGSPDDIQFFLHEFPLLHDKLYVRWDGAAEPIVRNLQQWLDGPLASPSPAEDLVICGRCRSAFQHGVYVCLGCRGHVVYGATLQERSEAVQRGMFVPVLAGIAALVMLPATLRHSAQFPIPDLWGLSFPMVASIVGASSIVGGFVWSRHVVKSMADVVRTFPP